MDDGEIQIYDDNDADHTFFTSGPTVGFEVSDFSEAHHELIRAGIEFIGHPQTDGVTTWGHFRGPDGNIYEILGPAGSRADNSWHHGVMRKRTLFIGLGVAAGVAAAVSAVQRQKPTSEDSASEGEKRSSKTFEYAKVEGNFLEVAPVKGSLKKRMPASAETLFRVLEDADAWPQWLDAVQEVTWTAPLGVGATRDIKMGNMVIQEHFFEWEDGRLMGFRFERGPLPLIEAFAERWQIDPVSETECDITWTYGFQAKGPIKAAHPLIAKGIPSATEKWLDQLAEFVKTHVEDYQAAE